MTDREHVDLRPIVLVHGAWVGEWSWLPIFDQLCSSGRPVHMVSLTGHGIRRHESGPHITLADHVRDLVAVFETLDLHDAVLVAHSYGGRVATSAFPTLEPRLAHVIYLDAHTPVAPDPGQTPERIALAEANGGMLPFPDIYLPSPDMVGGTEGVAWFEERVEQHSFRTFTAEWQVELPADLPKTFVFAAGDPKSRFAGYAGICRADPAWRYHEIAGHHFLMMSHPTETAQIILDV